MRLDDELTSFSMDRKESEMLRRNVLVKNRVQGDKLHE